jgi:hypothetical protein
MAAKKKGKTPGGTPKVPFGGKKAAPFKKGGGRIQKGAQ